MIKIYDRMRVKRAILQNAFDITETLKINAVYNLQFSLPYNDSKNQFCQPYCLAEWNGRLYRILPCALDVSDTGSITYNCEHVIASLLDKSLFGYYHVGGVGVHTDEVIRWLLSHQSDWQLGRCDFSRQFEYGWEQENLLSALFSVPSRFSDIYMWDYDTSEYPWTLHLKRIDTAAIPQLYIRNEKNMIQLLRKSDPQQICTRIYPLGYGEGINQLTIKSVNGGVPYLQSPQSYTEKYGIIERIWIDRRYEDAESLKQAAQMMLSQLQEPTVEYGVSFAELDGGIFDEADIGKIALIIDTRTDIKQKTFISEIVRNNADIRQSSLTLANSSCDIASTVADIADRQRIEAAYSQGATQLYSQALQSNADASGGAVIDFFIPSDMRIVNKVLLKVRMESFRAYSQATDGGGATTQTSTEGGAITQTSTEGGGTTESSGASSSKTTQSGGADTTEDSEESDSDTKSWTNETDGSKGDHRHTYTVHLLPHHHAVSNHSHNMSHTHEIDIPGHTHSVNIPNHTHAVSIPAHTHSIKPGIYRYGNPKSFTIFVNGKQCETINAANAEINLTPYLLDNGKIPRGGWLSVEIRPDDLAYVTLVLFVQGFIQSRGDMTV